MDLHQWLNPEMNPDMYIYEYLSIYILDWTRRYTSTGKYTSRQGARREVHQQSTRRFNKKSLPGPPEVPPESPEGRPEPPSWAKLGLFLDQTHVTLDRSAEGLNVTSAWGPQGSSLFLWTARTVMSDPKREGVYVVSYCIILSNQ